MNHQHAIEVAVLALALVPACASASDEPNYPEKLASVQQPAVSCPSASAPRQVGKLADAELVEASGLVASLKYPGLLYSHNDSGGRARVYALNEAGELIARIDYSGARAQDWEDVAIGPGPVAQVSYIYVGDIGDNARSRSEVRVLRCPEPELDASARGQSITTTYQTIRLRYPDGAHNAEALAVDPVSSDLYILTKEDNGASGLYVARAPQSTSSTTVLERSSGLNFGRAPLSGSPLVTGTDIANDGSAVIVRTYTSAFLWTRASGFTISGALAQSPCAMPVANEPQGEAIAFSVDRRAFYTVSEGANAPVYRTDLTF